MQNDVRWLLVDALVKVTLLLALGCAVSLVLSRAAAARRHLAWLLTITSALLLPPLAAVLPGWHVLPVWSNSSLTTASTQSAPWPTVPVLQSTVSTGFRGQDATPRLVTNPPPLAASSVAAEPARPVPRPPRSDAPIPAARSLLANHPITIVPLAFWLLGCLFLFGKVLISWLSLRRLARISIVAPDNYLTSIMQDAAGDLNLHRPVRLLISQDRAMPMTWGIVRPTILLPADSQTWPRSRARLVILHELAHVKRRDALAQLISQIAGAIYWFHPLIWPAIRGLARQQESAADDLVLKTQASPAEYAGLLLELAASLRASARGNPTAIAMARPFAMEVRLRAVLDASRRRGGISFAGVVVGLLVTFTIIAPLAALRTRAQVVAGPATKPAANRITYTGHVLSAEGKPVAGAEVVLQMERHGEVDRATSATDGRFVVTGPPLSHVSSSVTVAVRAVGLGFGSARMMQENDNVIQLLPPSRVRVTLLGPDDKPATGLRIRPTFTAFLGPLFARTRHPGELGAIYHPESWSGEPALITDATGTCLIPLLPRQSRTQFQIDSQDYAQPSISHRIQTGAGAESQAVVVHLKRAGFIAGTVTSGATGLPVSGIHLIAISSSPKGEVVTHGAEGDVVTDARGEYHIGQIEAGEYMMRLREPVDFPFTAAFRKNVAVVEGQTTAGQDFVLVKGSLVSGRVLEADTGRGVPDASVWAVEPDTRQYPGYTDTDAEGRYSLRVPPGLMGIYMATPPPDGYSNIGFDAHKAFQITAVDGQDITLDLKLTLLPGIPVTGRVLDADGKPLVGASVEAEKATADFLRGSSYVKTDEHGEFRFRAIMPGTQLSARLGEMGTLESVAVNGGEKNITLQMAASATTTLVGTVLDENGKPIANARIGLGMMHGMFGFGPAGTPTTLTDVNGKFSIPNLGPGATYRLQVDADGYGTAKMDVPFKAGEAICQLGEIKLSKGVRNDKAQ